MPNPDWWLEPPDEVESPCAWCGEPIGVIDPPVFKKEYFCSKECCDTAKDEEIPPGKYCNKKLWSSCPWISATQQCEKYKDVDLGLDLTEFSLIKLEECK